MGVHRNIDANFLRGVMPKVPSKKHPYENFGMPYVFLWILHLGNVVARYEVGADRRTDGRAERPGGVALGLRHTEVEGVTL